MSKVKKLRSEIKYQKQKLKRKANQKGGVWENFGQDVVRELNREYFEYGHSGREVRQLLSNFNKWCMTYGG